LKSDTYRNSLRNFSSDQVKSISTLSITSHCSMFFGSPCAESYGDLAKKDPLTEPRIVQMLIINKEKTDNVIITALNTANAYKEYSDELELDQR
jgi:hypothetical protein